MATRLGEQQSSTNPRDKHATFILSAFQLKKIHLFSLQKERNIFRNAMENVEYGKQVFEVKKNKAMNWPIYDG